MAKDGLGYFYNRLGLSSDDLAFHYNFSGGSGNSVAVYSGQSQYSGTLSGHASFWGEAGSGSFSEGTFSVNNYSALNAQNWTVLSVVEKERTENEVIFSTMDASKNSGVIAHIDHANNVVVTTKDSNGYLFSESYDINLSNKNILGFSKAGNTISCFRYNPSELTSEVKSKTFPSSSRLNNYDQFNIGHSLSDVSNPFSGKIDDFALIASPVNLRQFDVLSSGFVRDSFTLSTDTIPSYTFGNDHCTEGAYISGFSGTTYGQTVATPSDIDFQFLQTFQKSAAKLAQCEAFSNFYIAKLDQNPINDFNKSLVFDSVNGKYKSLVSHNASQTIFYLSGLLRQSGDNYTYSQRLFNHSGGSTSNGSGVLDVTPHSINTTGFVSGDFTSGSTVMANNGNSLLFVNGEVLVSGLDYHLSGGNFILDTNSYSAASGEAQELVFSTGSLEVYSSSQNFQELDFYDSAIMVFLDRKRIPLSRVFQMSDYETGANSGSVVCVSGEVIYNNEGNYFNE